MYMVLFLLLLVCTCSAQVSVSDHHAPSLSAQANIPGSEMSALYDFYIATNGAEWASASPSATGVPWNFLDPNVSNPCTSNWQGIYCSFPAPYLYYHVTRIVLPSYNLAGTLPDTLDALPQLQYLVLNSNHLTGSIPASLGNLSQLSNLLLYENELTGEVPTSLGNLTQLQSLYLITNYLSGTIPESLSKLTQLRYLLLGTNDLTGTIPASLGKLTQLQYLLLGTNKLEGTIPASLGNLYQLQYAIIYKNQLTGSVPHSLGRLTKLFGLYLGSNLLTGTIPESLGNLTQLNSVNLENNHISGKIPASFGSMLLFIYLFNNHLTGTVPDMFNPGLQQIRLSNNRLSGQIPTLKLLYSLQVVQLQNNRFTGTLDHVFDPHTQSEVVMIVLDNNQLTGTLPEAIFRLKPQSFSAINNCFRAPLPITAMCNNNEMVNFIVDGMSSAASCRNKLFNGYFSAYSLQFSIGGSIPTCLFQLPNITTLHLSGNGFTGSIPGDIVLSTTLTDLSLSHNVLTGSIPDQIQLRNWKNLDLAHNRFSGTLLPDFASNGTVKLDNSRLSGVIPASFHALSNISILGSNTFTCSFDKSDLPEHDANSQNYRCGSNSFETLFYIWLGAAVVTACVLGYCEWKYQIWCKLISVRDSKHKLWNTNLYRALCNVRTVSMTCAFYTVLVLLPLYALCNMSYGTQTYMYAYEVSAVFKAGVVPFALDWLFWMVLLLAVVVYLLPPRRAVHDEKTSKSAFKWQIMYIFIPYLLIDFVAVIGVNAAYVYVAVYQSSQLLFIVQTLLSIFNVVWGRLALPYVLALLNRRTHRKYGKVQVITQIVINIVNNIVIPCLVVAVISPNCYYYALVAAPTVSSSVNYDSCTYIYSETECLLRGPITVPTVYDPPFTYNFQCSSSLITYYCPAFVSMCIVSTFVSPLSEYCCQYLHRRASVGTYWYALLDVSLAEILKPINERTGTEVDHVSYLDSGGLMTTLISTLGLILTFGVMFPPLCVALVISTLATIVFFRANVSRFINKATQEQHERVVAMIRAECNSVDSMQIFRDSLWALVTVSCLFYTLFLFDTLGNAVGLDGAYWVLIVMPLMPLMMYLVYSALHTYFPIFRRFGDRQFGETDKVEQIVEVEMVQATVEDNLVVHNVLLAAGESEASSDSAVV